MVQKRNKKSLKRLIVNTENKSHVMSNSFDTLSQANQAFNENAVTRDLWSRQDYVKYIQKLDSVQNEAFLMKGKLIAEMKKRFFEHNTSGWKKFADIELKMNYTTANQYIRVSQEFDSFDVNKHSLSFEHYKALLPLNKEEREGIFQNLEYVSVKELRELVKKKLNRGKTPEDPRIIEQILKSATHLNKLLDENSSQLSEFSQKKVWQLYGALKNMAYRINELADKCLFSKESEPFSRSKYKQKSSNKDFEI